MRCSSSNFFLFYVALHVVRLWLVRRDLLEVLLVEVGLAPLPSVYRHVQIIAVGIMDSLNFYLFALVSPPRGVEVRLLLRACPPEWGGAVVGETESWRCWCISGLI